MIIHGTNITLREITAEDTDYIVSLRNDPELNLFVSRVTREEHKRWLKKYLADDNDYYFVIAKRDGRRCGLIALYEIDATAERAVYGRFILAKVDRPLYASEALFYLLDFGFNTLGLKIIYGEMQGDNIKSISFAKSFGFSLAGIRRGAYFNRKLNKAEDVHRYEITREAFNAMQSAFRRNFEMLKGRLH